MNFRIVFAVKLKRKYNVVIFMVPVQVEAGDVILKVNETDVNRLNTKEGELYYHNILIVFMKNCFTVIKKIIYLL